MSTPRPDSNSSNLTAPVDSLANTGLGLSHPQVETVSPNPVSPPEVDADVDCGFLTSPQSPDEIGRLGPYSVRGILGSGGMGMVVRARDPELDREIAIKVILPKFAARPHARERFIREARAVASVEHPHVVQIFHVGEDDGLPYLVMPLLKGVSLAAWLKRDPHPSLLEVVRIGREIAEGLAAAHAKHLVHRDVKPGNVWLEGDGRWVRLLDFGLARHDEPSPREDEQLTAPGQFVGTPDYVSPEQAGGQPVTPASDLFSLGIVLYQMTTGVIPFAAPTILSVLNALATRQPEPPTHFAPELPPELNLLIVQLLAKDPLQRPRSALAVAATLRQIEIALTPATHSHSIPPTVPTAAPATAALPAPRRSRQRVLLAIATGLLLIGVGVMAQQQIRIPTAKGTLLIDSDDPNVEIVVKKNGAVIRDKTRDREIALEIGDYTIELTEGKDGLKLSTDRFSITRNGKETVKVWLEKPTPLPAPIVGPLPAEQYRNLLEWVLKQDQSRAMVQLSTGESTHLQRGDRIPLLHPSDLKGHHLVFSLPNPEGLPPQVATWLKALPAERIVEIVLDSPKWDDASIGRFVAQVREVRNLRLQFLSQSGITDVGLRHVLQVPGLRGLSLAEVKVSDKGVQTLAKHARLERIHLATMPVSDTTVEEILSHRKYRAFALLYTHATRASLPAILKQTELEELSLRGIPLEDEDLHQFTALKKLQGLSIWGPRITNGGIDKLAELPSLSQLDVVQASRLDQGVFESLARIKNLSWLAFSSVKITDVGLAKVKTLPNLTFLHVHDVGVTPEAVARLRTELPKLQVVWDDEPKMPNVVEPIPADLYRKFVEWVLKQDRGSVHAQTAKGEWVSLHREDAVPPLLHPVTDGGWASFYLPDPDALPAHVATWIKALPAGYMVEVQLDSPKWDDGAIGRLVAQLREVRNLRLAVYGTEITDAGLEAMLQIPGLRGMYLHGVKVSNEGIRKLANHARIDRTSLSGIPVTDATVAELLSHRTYRQFGLLDTKATRDSLVAILKQTDLEDLVLHDVPLNDEDLQKFTTLKNLQNLGVWGPQLSNEGIAKLAELPLLQRLNVAQASRIDQGVFVSLAKLKHLSSLTLIGVQITDAGLAKVKTLPKLTSLHLNNVGVTPEGVARLRTELPKLHVTWDDEPEKQK